jgi:hypothetical protein
MATSEQAEQQRLADELTARLSEQLPDLVLELVRSGVDLLAGPVQLECSLRSANRLASIEIDSVPSTPDGIRGPILRQVSGREGCVAQPISPCDTPAQAVVPYDGSSKRRKATGGLRVTTSGPTDVEDASLARRLGSDSRVFPQRKKRLPENPALQPSTLDKFIGGIWDSIYSGIRLDPSEVIEQWQAIESSGQPRLLTDANNAVVSRDRSVVQGNFGRMSKFCKNQIAASI